MQHSRRGFSFFEVTIVVLIIGVLAAIGVPRFVHAARTRNARNAALQLADSIDYVRHTAINQGRVTSLAIDDKYDSFSSPDVDFPDRAGTLINIAVKDQFDQSIELSAAFDSVAKLSFDLEGMPIADGQPMREGVISIRSEDIVFRIQISPGLGTTTFTVERDGEKLDAAEAVAVAPLTVTPLTE